MKVLSKPLLVTQRRSVLLSLNKLQWSAICELQTFGILGYFYNVFNHSFSSCDFFYFKNNKNIFYKYT